MTAGVRPVVLVVPAYNESLNLCALLDSVQHQPLPPDLQWREWAVLDDGSTDGTPEVAACWGRRHPYTPLRVALSEHRSGKAANLARYHVYVRRRWPDAFVVVVDADVRVDAGALGTLVSPLAVDPHLAITWGMARVGLREPGRLASAFQLDLAGRVRMAAGATVSTAYGAFFAYRVSALRGFKWESSLIADDSQLSAYITRNRLRALSVPEATTAVIPARGWRDFASQTRRYHSSVNRLREEGLEEERHVSVILLLYAIAKSALSDPIGFGAYVLARTIEPVITLRYRTTIAPTWRVSTSTKGFGRTL